MLADHADLNDYWRLTQFAVRLVYLIDLLIKHTSAKTADQLAEWGSKLEKVSDRLESLPEAIHTEVNRAYRRRWGTAYLFGKENYASAPDAVRTLARSVCSLLASEQRINFSEELGYGETENSEEAESRLRTQNWHHIDAAAEDREGCAPDVIVDTGATDQIAHERPPQGEREYCTAEAEILELLSPAAEGRYLSTKEIAKGTSYKPAYLKHVLPWMVETRKTAVKDPNGKGYASP